MTNLLFKGSQSVCSGRQGEQITPCHNSRTKLRMKLLNVEKQDNIEFYLSCKFQPSTFNVRCKTDVTDGMPDKQTNERTTVCRGSAPRHNYSHQAQHCVCIKIFKSVYYTCNNFRKNHTSGCDAPLEQNEFMYKNVNRIQNYLLGQIFNLFNFSFVIRKCSSTNRCSSANLNASSCWYLLICSSACLALSSALRVLSFSSSVFNLILSSATSSASLALSTASRSSQ